MMTSLVLNEQSTRLIMDIKKLDKKFRKSCDQILLLNNQIEDLQVRYDRAMKANRRSFRYSLRLRLATLEGVRNMFYEYASRCADSLEILQNQLVDAGGRDELYEDNVEWEPVASSDDDTLSDIVNDIDNLDESTDSNPGSPDDIPNYIYEGSSMESSVSGGMFDVSNDSMDSNENTPDENERPAGASSSSYDADMVLAGNSDSEGALMAGCSLGQEVRLPESVKTGEQRHEGMDSENVLNEADVSATVTALVSYSDAFQGSQ